MSLEALKSLLESKAALIGEAISKAVENHHGLSGMLQSTNETLQEIGKLLAVVAPESPAVEALNVAENVATIVENDAQPPAPAAS